MPGDLPTRVLIYGVTGSGKTTLAAKLSEKTGLPWHSVDDLTWEPGWIVVPVEEQIIRIKAICEQPAWILDTAYGKWSEIPLGKAQLVVALDYPRWVSLSRLFRRTVMRIVDRKPICNGNRESLRNMLSKESIIMWHFRSFRSKRARIEKWGSCPDGPQVLRFRKPDELERWLQSLSKYHGS